MQISSFLALVIQLHKPFERHSRRDIHEVQLPLSHMIIRHHCFFIEYNELEMVFVCPCKDEGLAPLGMRPSVPICSRALTLLTQLDHAVGILFAEQPGVMQQIGGYRPDLN